jgi:hypothetical protein
MFVDGLKITYHFLFPMEEVWENNLETIYAPTTGRDVFKLYISADSYLVNELIPWISHSREAGKSLENISHILWTLEVHFVFHKSPPLDSDISTPVKKLR